MRKIMNVSTFTSLTEVLWYFGVAYSPHVAPIRTALVKRVEDSLDHLLVAPA